MAQSVILIGPPGSGKSTIGKALARKTGQSFTDTDGVIELRTGNSISQIFVDKGEPWFRQLEAEVLEEELRKLEGILSLGGGAPLSETAQNLLQKVSVAKIYLDVSLATAAPRVGFNRDRPLLLNNPRGAWQELMEKRRPIYEALATHIVKVDERAPKDIVDEIVRLTQ
jgi:shikimate kinase|uniref:shikimate kinase n=1 Tax=Candidatus Planktophila sp. TaxID=2175601 RepID=UPI00404A3D96